LAVGVLGQTDRPGLGDPLEPRSDVDAVAHQIAVTLLENDGSCPPTFTIIHYCLELRNDFH
jgi:hypothetical protein